MRLLKPITAKNKQLNGSMKKVEVHISALLALLDEGYAWLKSEDEGFGSIEEHLNASENEIGLIRKHPLLANAEPNFMRFILIDDVSDKDIANKLASFVEQEVETEKKRERKPKQFDVATDVTQADMFLVEETSKEELESFMNI